MRFDFSNYKFTNLILCQQYSCAEDTVLVSESVSKLPVTTPSFEVSVERIAFEKPKPKVCFCR